MVSETWIMDGVQSVFCFDGDALAYMISEFEGQENLIGVVKASQNADESRFVIPDDYTVTEY